MWLQNKRKIQKQHYDAGVKFRGDGELANRRQAPRQRLRPARGARG